MSEIQAILSFTSTWTHFKCCGGGTRWLLTVWNG